MAEKPYLGTDPTILKINKLLQDAVTGVLVRSVEAEIILVQPWMGAPVWKQIWQFFFEWSVSNFYDNAKKFIFIKITDAQIAAQVLDAQKVTDTLAAEISKPVEAQDAEQIRKQLEEFDRTMERLITFPRPA